MVHAIIHYHGIIVEVGQVKTNQRHAAGKTGTKWVATLGTGSVPAGK